MGLIKGNIEDSNLLCADFFLAEYFLEVGMCKCMDMKMWKGVEQAFVAQGTELLKGQE